MAGSASANVASSLSRKYLTSAWQLLTFLTGKENFRPGSIRLNGAAELAARARLYVSEAGQVAHDTLSNLEAICGVRAAAAPSSGLLLISDPLHMLRIWRQRSRIDCLNSDLLGYDTIAVAGGPIRKWCLAHTYWLAEATREVLGEQLYRAAVHVWRRHQSS